MPETEGAAGARLVLRTTGRPGPMLAAVRRSLRDAPDSARSRPSWAAYAQMAEKAADLVDAAWRAGDVGLVRSCLRELRTLLVLLALDPGVEGERGDRGEPAGERRGGGDGLGDLEREMAELVGAGPTFRDPEDA